MPRLREDKLALVTAKAGTELQSECEHVNTLKWHTRAHIQLLGEPSQWDPLHDDILTVF